MLFFRGHWMKFAFQARVAAQWLMFLVAASSLGD
jgi:hypothetical protein